VSSLFERGEERLADGVIERATLGAHRESLSRSS
jgi:hypothetical protein